MTSFPTSILPILSPVLFLLILTIALMSKDSASSRIALRNFTRRKTTTILVVLGLLIGTAMISGSLVAGDTSTHILTSEAYSNFGAVDEGVYNLNPQVGYQFFNYSVYDSLRSHILGNQDVAGVTPEIISTVSIFDKRSDVGQAQVILIGAYPNSTSVLGNYSDQNGKTINPDTGSNGAIVNYQTARDINASVGDKLEVFYGRNSTILTITGIDYSHARSGFPYGSDHIVVNLQVAQSITGEKGKINFIAITNAGGIQNSIQYTNRVGALANATLESLGNSLGNSSPLYAFGDKNESVSSALKSAMSTSQIFLIVSSFTVAVGTVLIVNVFVMLSEERKQEMGMARALGMKRSHLVKQFMFEGFFYSLLSSSIGAVSGIGIALVMIYIFGSNVIGLSGATGSSSVIIDNFTFTPETLIVAFSSGILITYLTIIISSFRVGRLNIIRAIRNISEPPASKSTHTRMFFIGLAIVALGLLSFMQGNSSRDATLFVLGPAIAIFGLGLILTKFIGERYAFSISSVLELIYWGDPYLSVAGPFTPPLGYYFLPAIIGLFFMVASAVALVSYNTSSIMKVLLKTGKGASRSPTLKMGLSYPQRKRFRTGGILLMFALIIAVIIGLGVLLSLFNGIAVQEYPAITGGYQMLASTSTPVPGLYQKIVSDPNVSSYIAANRSTVFYGTYALTKDLSRPNESALYVEYLGANNSGSNNFFSENSFNLTSATSPFLLSNGKPNPEKVWEQVQSNHSDVVYATNALEDSAPRSEQRYAGDLISIELPNGTKTNVTEIAVMSWAGPPTLLTTTQAIEQDHLVASGQQFAMISLSNKKDAELVSIGLKRDFLSYGMTVIVYQDILAQILQGGNAQTSLLESFVGFGLIVGIAGLSIITVRSVVERRREIGTLRALGFTEKMILWSFLIENSFIAIFGILIGILVGLSLVYSISLSFPHFHSLGFSVPLVSITEIGVIAYGFALLATAWPALNASKILPAEALRYAE